MSAIPVVVLIAIGIIIQRDSKTRGPLSSANWIPTAWILIISSRPISYWLESGGGSSLEGSPIDRAAYLLLIGASIYTLIRRPLVLSHLRTCWPLLIYYAYFLFSTTWAEVPGASFRRWFKDFGNIWIALVLLSDANPQQAIRAVYYRCASILIPASFIAIRYFPEIGRRYNIHSGEMEAVGISVQKNSLGVLVLTTLLVLYWDILERKNAGQLKWRILAWPICLVAMGAWLLKTCDSKTSIVLLVLGAGILTTTYFPSILIRLRSIGAIGLIIITLGYAIDSLFSFSEEFVAFLGRDMTFTGRTAVWDALLNLRTDFVFGTGFCSFWDNPHYLSLLSDGIGASAHNGYLETYLDGGIIGVTVLLLLLVTIGRRITNLLQQPNLFTLFLLAIFLTVLIGNFTESHFGRMSAVWFLTILVAIASAPKNNFGTQT